MLVGNGGRALGAALAVLMLTACGLPADGTPPEPARSAAQPAASASTEPPGDSAPAASQAPEEEPPAQSGHAPAPQPITEYIADFAELERVERLDNRYAGSGSAREMTALPGFDSTRYTRQGSLALVSAGDLFVLVDPYGVQTVHRRPSTLYYYDGGGGLYTLQAGVTEIAGARDNAIYLVGHAEDISWESAAPQARALYRLDPAVMETARLREGVVSALIEQDSSAAYLTILGDETPSAHNPDQTDWGICVVRWDMSTGEETLLWRDEGAYPEGVYTMGDDREPFGLMYAFDAVLTAEEDAVCVTLHYPIGSEVPYPRKVRIDRACGSVLSDSEEERLAGHRQKAERIRSGDWDSPGNVIRQSDAEPDRMETETLELESYRLVLERHFERQEQPHQIVETDFFAERGGERTLLASRAMSHLAPAVTCGGDLALLSLGDDYVYDGQGLYRIAGDSEFHLALGVNGRLYLSGDDRSSLHRIAIGADGPVCETIFRVSPAPGAEPAENPFDKGPRQFGDFLVYDTYYNSMVWYNTVTGEIAALRMDGLILDHK